MNEIWFSASRKEKIFLWREFRKSLIGLEFTEILQQTVEWWSTAPISANVFDPYAPDTWPNAWDFLWQGQFDENSVALGMAYTLHLEKIAKCELLLVQKHVDNSARLVVLVDNQYVLNYSYKDVTSASILKKCDILHTKVLN
jgi:hypothetical protein